MAGCDFKGCTKDATTKGYIYGHHTGSGEKDSFISVQACDTHKERDGFFEDKPESASS